MFGDTLPSLLQVPSIRIVHKRTRARLWLIPALSASLVVLLTNAAAAQTQHVGGSSMPSALPVTLAAVSCASPRICVAVGGQAITVPLASIAARTTDGGTEWASTLFGAASAQLSALACPTARRCIAVGGRTVGTSITGTAIRSEDGGRSWRVSNMPKGVGRLASISCPSWGSALPSVPPSWTDCPASRWYPHDLVGMESGRTSRGEKGLALVTCSTQEHCIAVGGDPWGPARPSSPRRTRGGPGTSPSVPPVNSVGLPGAEESRVPAFRNASLSGTRFASQTVKCRRDTSGPVRMVERIGPLSAAGRHELLDCRLVVTAAHCVAVGGGVLPRGGVVRSILTTTDGGRTWVSRVVPTLAAGLSGVSCSTAEECMAVGGGFASASPSAALAPVVLVTHDGGVSWSAGPSVAHLPGELGHYPPSIAGLDDCVAFPLTVAPSVAATAVLRFMAMPRGDLW